MSFTVLIIEFGILNFCLLALRNMLDSRRGRNLVEFLWAFLFCSFLLCCGMPFSQDLPAIFGFVSLAASFTVYAVAFFKRYGTLFTWKCQIENKYAAMVLMAGCVVFGAIMAYRCMHGEDASCFMAQHSNDGECETQVSRNSLSLREDNNPFRRTPFEFYGVNLGAPSNLQTNTLEKQETMVELVTEGKTSRYVRLSWKRHYESLRPKDFFDFGEVQYSYDSLTAERAMFFAHFPNGATLKECIAMLVDLESDMRARYGIILVDSSVPPNEDEPDGFRPGTAPANLACGWSRYMCRKENMFYGRRFRNGRVSINLVAGETCYGERCAVLLATSSIGESESEGIEY